MEEMKMKNLMKKSVVSIVVVLVAASLASAAGFMVGGSASANIPLGGTVKVELVTDGAKSMTLEQIIDGASITGAASNMALSDGWTWDDFDSLGTAVNAGGVLIENATGTVMFGDPEVIGTAYSFDYTLAAGVPLGETFQIGPGAGTNKIGGVPVPLNLTVVPEPMTIALLGLGGLFLRRKK
jgi:hypothetical protein